MIILEVSVCALTQGAFIAKQMFTDDLNHFFDHIGIYMTFIFLTGREAPTKKKPCSWRGR